MTQFMVPYKFKRIYSSLSQSLQMLNIIKQFIKQDLSVMTITDSTGGIGGNSYVFCKYFGFVNIIEIDSDNIEALSANLNYFYNKSIIHANYVELFTKIKQDIVFIDPPWGEYKKCKNVNLYLNQININHIISILYEYSNMVILKAPKNFNVIKVNQWDIEISQIYSENGIKHIYNAVIYYK